MHDPADNIKLNKACVSACISSACIITVKQFVEYTILGM